MARRRGRVQPLPPAGPPDQSAAQWQPDPEPRRPVRALARFAFRQRHVTIPLAAPWLLLAIAAAAHADHAGAITAAVTGTAALGISLAAGKRWDRMSEAIYATVSVFAASGWLTAAAYLGPVMPLRWADGIGCAAWGGIFWWHKRPRGRRERRRHARQVARWNLFWLSHAIAWGVGGSAVTDVEDTGAIESLLVQLIPGRQSIESARNLGPLIESALGGYVEHGTTRIAVNKADPSQVWVRLRRDEPLAEEFEWDPSITPTDIRKPAPIGVDETGNWVRRSLRASWLIVGRSRWGKSNELSVLLSTITGCRNARVLLIDRKGGRAARPWLRAVDWLATEIDEARLLLGFAEAEVRARAALAFDGENEQLEPTEIGIDRVTGLVTGCPTLFVVIDETHEVTSELAGDTKCAALVASIAGQGQGVEVYLIILTQYGALAESVRTEQTRSNLNYRLCFQTETREHGTFALGDDAHKLVDTTKIGVKGAFYFREDSKTRPWQIRGPHIPHGEVRVIAEDNAAATDLYSLPLRAYAADWQHIYDGRWQRLPARFHNDAPQVALCATPPAQEGAPVDKINFTPDRGPWREVDAAVAEINEQAADGPPVTEADLANAAAARAGRGDPPPDLLADHDARRRQVAMLLQNAGAEGITMAQLRAGSGLSKSWISPVLTALVDAGLLGKATVGRNVRYSPLGDIWAGMERIREDMARLGADARELVGAQNGNSQ